MQHDFTKLSQLATWLAGWWHTEQSSTNEMHSEIILHSFSIRVIFVIGKLHSIDYHLIDLIVSAAAAAPWFPFKWQVVFNSVLFCVTIIYLVWHFTPNLIDVCYTFCILSRWNYVDFLVKVIGVQCDEIQNFQNKVHQLIWFYIKLVYCVLIMIWMH